MTAKTPKDGISKACVSLAATRTATPAQCIVTGVDSLPGQSASR
jgi:hypothetical protein